MLDYLRASHVAERRIVRRTGEMKRRLRVRVRVIRIAAAFVEEVEYRFDGVHGGEEKGRVVAVAVAVVLVRGEISAKVGALLAPDFRRVANFATTQRRAKAARCGAHRIESDAVFHSRCPKFFIT